MATEVIGREGELAEVAAFLDARDGLPAGLVLEGDAGVGKTTVWHASVQAARERGFRTLVARPAEAETGFSFAGLADLFDGLLDAVLPALPPRQRQALEAALLVGDARAVAERRAVAAAVLGAFRSLAASPLLVAVDDVQWLDRPSAEALEYAARRLRQGAVGFLFARRVTSPDAPLEQEVGDHRLRRLAVGPLDLDMLHRLLQAHLAEPFPRPLLRRIHELSGGNPFYALELARAPERLERGRPLPATLDELVRSRLEVLPSPTRRALAAAAAGSQATLAGAERAADAPGSLAAAEAAGVIDVEEGRIRFTHPLLASAAYAAMPPEGRRALHARLGAAADDPEERGRHLALAATGPDEAVAAALDEAAAHARGRGAPASAAELTERAIRLTPRLEGDDRLRRTVDAGSLHFESGHSRRARELFEGAVADLPPGDERARVLTRLALVRGFDDDLHAATDLLLQAIAEGGAGTAARAHAQGELAGVLFRRRERLTEAADHARSAVAVGQALGDRRLVGLAAANQLIVEAAHGRPGARTTLGLALAHQADSEHLRILAQPKLIAAVVWMWWEELDAARATYGDLLVRAREVGDEASLPYVHVLLAQAECLAGRFTVAAAHADEGHALAEQARLESVTGYTLAVRALAQAHGGDEDAARQAGRRALESARRTNGSLTLLFASAALGLLELSLGNPSAAEAQLADAVELARANELCEPTVSRFAADLVEARIQLGRHDEAIDVLDWWEGNAERLDRRGALATAARLRALLAAAAGDLDGALATFERALDQPLPFERARALLAYGAALRRAKRKRDARRALEEALSEFERLGAALLAGRAKAELARIGGRSAADGLTPTERRVAELVAEGRSNKEVAAALFVTVKTVEANLSRIYAKLGVSSRTALTRRLASKL
jgi:DNA-binding CsgD family transcriptional regulator